LSLLKGGHELLVGVLDRSGSPMVVGPYGSNS
jgi:hypothetical protein